MERLKQSPLTSDQPERVEQGHPVYTFLLHLAVYTFPWVWLATVYQAGQQLWHLNQPWLILLGIPLGWVIMDFLSGWFHWLFDTYGSPQTPIIGPTVEIFRVHHELPQDICKSNLVFTVGHVAVFALPAVMIVWLALLLFPNVLLLAFGGFTFAIISFMGVMTNQFHKWAHSPNPSRFIQILQAGNIILNPEHHSLHHREQFDRYYAITSGWTNTLLTRTQFFRHMETRLAQIGIKRYQDLDP